MRTSTGLPEAHPAPIARPTVSSSPPTHRRQARWLLVTVDTVALLASSLCGVALWGLILGSAAPAGSLRPGAWLPFVPVALLMVAAYGLYRRPARRVRSLTFLDLAHLFHALTLAGLVTLAVSGVMHRLTGVAKVTWSEVAACAIPALAAVPLVRAALTAIMDRNGIPRTRVIVVGSGAIAERLIGRLRRFGDIDFVGWVEETSSAGTQHRPTQFLGTGTELGSLCRHHGVDRVLVALDDWNGRPLADWLRSTPISTQVSIVGPSSDLVTCRSVIDEFHGLPVIDIMAPPPGTGQRIAKRTIDVVVSAGMLLVLSPLMVLTAICIRRRSPGSVLFRQERVGRNGRSFVMYKFRTMTASAEGAPRPVSDMDGPVFKVKADPRVTSVGRVLRRNSVDEIPQLFNVLRGQMSLVGPRPLPTAESAAFSGWAARRLDVRPGMTGYWQVSGRNDLTFAELQQLDHAYATSWSLWWDLKILWQTPGAVLGRRGAY
jgi:exopolysaccharide biosynthesis polyprenyl glycosylphosphotransferase